MPLLSRHQRTWHWLVAAVLLLQAGASYADLWGYVDTRGVAHFSATRVDERYELFLRGDISGRTAQTQTDTTKAVGVPTAPKRLLAFFDVSTNYKAVRPIMRQVCERHQIDYELLKALIATESGFDPKALSPKGAIGLMQLTPVTAQRFGLAAEPKVNLAQRLADPQTNIAIGAQYLAYLMNLYKGDVELALAAYNSGEGSVLRAGNRIPEIPETQNFVQTVLQLYRVLKPPVTTAQPKSRAFAMTRGEQARLATGRANMPVPLDAATVGQAQAAASTSQRIPPAEAAWY
jgi:Transglycosylase SLT domain